MVVLSPGGRRTFDQAEWRGALVVVEQGEIDLVRPDGSRCRFKRGDILWLDGLSLRSLHNAGHERATLVAISRRPPVIDTPG